MPQDRETAFHDPGDALALSRPVRIALGVLLAAAVATSTALALSAVGGGPGRPDVVDFHPFYLAGRLALEGRFADSYDVSRLHALLTAFGGRDALIPFVYPPSFGLLLAPLALLPFGAAFLLFTSTTLGFYAAILRRLAGPLFWTALMAAAPAVVVNLRMGQNGLLTGALAGAAVAALLGRRPGMAGVAAGLLAFKPQVAVLLPVLFALRRDWTALAAAAATAAAATLLAVLAFGAGCVRAFLGSAAVVAGFMTDGSLHLNRVTSIYACALSLGAAPRLALVLHACVLAAVAGAAAAVLRRRAGTRGAEVRSAGLLLMATAFVSPYFSDYDLPVFLAGLALLLPDLARALPAGRLAALLIGAGVAEFAGVVLGASEVVPWPAAPSLGGPLLLLCFGAVVRAVDGDRGEPRPLSGPTQTDGPSAWMGRPTDVEAVHRPGAFRR